MSSSIDTSATAALAAVRRREISVADLTSRFLSRVFEGNAKVSAVRHCLADTAMAEALAVDERIAAGEELPVLAGLPVLVKENCDVAGVPCSAGLSFRSNHVPSTDADITSRLRGAGAIIIGTSVSDPGAFGVRTAEVTHPEDSSLTVGGSSGGSAAGLAAGFCLGAIGTDTGGSVRIPSACCSIVGLKPTFGALPMTGIYPLVHSLDHVGPMARSVPDVRALWAGLSGRPPRYASKFGRIGYDPSWVEIADAPIRAAFEVGLRKLADRGMEIVEIELPDLGEIASMHGSIFLTEAAAYHLANHGEHIETYPQLARQWFAAAMDMTVAGYVDARSKRVAMTHAIDCHLAHLDALITPTLAVARPRRDAPTVSIQGIEHDYTMGLVRLTALFDHTGHPAASVPVSGAPDRLCSSVQVIGSYGKEEVVLDVAAMLE